MKSSVLSIETETKDAWKHIWSIADSKYARQFKQQPDSSVKKNRERKRKGGSEIEKDWMNESRAMTENGGIQASAAVNAYVVHTLNN